MTGKTSYLGMTTYNTTTDGSSTLVSTYINQSSGCLVTTNAGILDQFARTSSCTIQSLSASATSVQASVNTIKSRGDSAVVQVLDTNIDVTAASGVFYFRTPSGLNGMNLTRAQGYLITAGTGNTTVQLTNVTKYPANSVLSTPITILSGCTVGTVGTINTSYDDFSTDDQLKIYVSGSGTVAGKGLQVVLEWTDPT